MPLVKVNGTNFVRDTKSMGLSNTNYSEREEYYAKSKILNNQKTEINKVKSEIDILRNDIGDIKSLLQQLLEKGSNG